MAKFEVVKVFPTSPPVRRGQIVEDPQWRNLARLVRVGYLRPVEDVPEPVPEPAASKKPKTKKGAKDGNK